MLPQDPVSQQLFTVVRLTEKKTIWNSHSKFPMSKSFTYVVTSIDQSSKIRNKKIFERACDTCILTYDYPCRQMTNYVPVLDVNVALELELKTLCIPSMTVYIFLWISFEW